MIKTIYTIPAPDYRDAKIEVYGEPENAWYEWRIIDGGRTVRDTGTEGHSAFQGRQYFQAEIALRDALMYASGLPIDGDTKTDEKELYKLIKEAKKQEQYWMERALKAEEELAQRNAAKNKAWDLIANTIENARKEGTSKAFFSTGWEYQAEIWVKYIGGLPAIGYRNLDTGETKNDVTAFQLLKVLEMFE